MKLVIAVVQDKDSNRLSNQLIQKGFGATKLASTGGFLKSGNTTFLIGVEEERVEEVLQVIKDTCKSREKTVTPMSNMGGSSGETYVPYPVTVQVGGATVFVVDVQQFAHF
ncbi:cyclic-di-AMP receptor [Tumebacillus lipolyticus]|uniref:Cyclic-di-AMP receptor n=1 Tax=Tumebacillus lipolyticus TaxID=1280370 RepID=A0ABW4ZYU9_9BACL